MKTPKIPEEVRAYMAAIGEKGGKFEGRKGLGAMSPEKQAEVQAAGRAARKKKLEDSANKLLQ